MSPKLWKLKESLALEEAAKCLSILLNEEVTTRDLLELSLKGLLILSMKLENRCLAFVGVKRPLHDATLLKIRAPATGSDPELEEMQGSEKQAFLTAFTERVQQIDHATDDTAEQTAFILNQVARQTAGNAPIDYTVGFKEDVLPGYSGVLEYESAPPRRISGLWDLSMLGTERIEIKNMLLGDGTVFFPSVRCYGIMLKQPSTNQWAHLCKPCEGPSTSDGTYALFSVPADAEPDDTRYLPNIHLPEREQLVIRREELQRFADSLSEPETTEDEPANQLKTLPSDFRALYDSLAELPYFDLAGLAWRKFWRGRRLNDGHQYPSNAEVSLWLVEHPVGPSKNLADAIATMIRPDWAPSGRRPN
ncbi:hypothetical protein [Marinobacter sp. F4218]|uniref:hypothetical protein n=1 Tax=Marinobacter sp. F4218 TaxID=2862868 RepID=UPI001C6310E9|nr:hypothetical protein [Marinobacter sp. F4218]MBW7471149.1 hypothetical protein [Marinobacter sp. F4218]